MTAVIICDGVLLQDRPQVYLHVKPPRATIKAERRIRVTFKRLSITSSVDNYDKVLLTDCC